MSLEEGVIVPWDSLVLPAGQSLGIQNMYVIIINIDALGYVLTSWVKTDLTQLSKVVRRLNCY